MGNKGWAIPNTPIFRNGGKVYHNLATRVHELNIQGPQRTTQRGQPDATPRLFPVQVLYILLYKPHALFKDSLSSNSGHSTAT